MAQALPAFTLGNRAEESQEMMNKLSCDICVRWLCGILFSVFAFCWLFFLQRDLVSAEFTELFPADSSFSMWISHQHLLVSLILTALALLLAIPGRILLRFKKGLFACNYLFSALFLAVITGYDGESLIGQTYTEWIVAGVFMLMLFLVCKIVASVPKSGYNDRPRTLAGNLLLMSLLFCLTGYLGNTDENLHRRLRLEQLFLSGNYDRMLQVGRLEEESDRDIDLLRAKAMLNIGTGKNPAGSGIGDNLFSFRISDPHALAVALRQDGGHEAYLASCLLEGESEEFCQGIDISSYNPVPKYYMQALVMAADSSAQNLFPDQFSKEKSVYDNFVRALEPLSGESSVFRSNSTFIDYHDTYFWFSQFCIR